MKTLKTLVFAFAAFGVGTFSMTSSALACDGHCNCKGGKACDQKNCDHTKCAGKEGEESGDHGGDKSGDHGGHKKHKAPSKEG